MFTGYMAIGGAEVINNHRVHQYAMKAGLGWVQGCGDCEPISHAHGEAFTFPLNDAGTSMEPPWWDTEQSYESSRFLGVMGVEFAGMDDSVRSVTVEGTNAPGGYIGAVRYTQRTTVVRAVLVAVDDCALGFGIEWLRSVDTDDSCGLTDISVYECCPCLCGAECDDPTCVGQCVDPKQRFFYDSRIVSGPTVLSRRDMSIGAMAEVEFTIVSGDPFPYAPVQTLEVFSTDNRTDYSEPAPAPAAGTDPFGLPVKPSTRTLLLPRRAAWQRAEHVVVLPGRSYVSPQLVVTNPNDEAVDDVRLTVRRDGEDRFGFRIPFLPAMSRVRLDFGRKQVFTQAGLDGPERLNPAFAYGPDGGLLRWPQRVPSGEYTVVVDTVPWAGTLSVEVRSAMMGLAG